MCHWDMLKFLHNKLEIIHNNLKLHWNTDMVIRDVKRQPENR